MYLTGGGMNLWMLHSHITSNYASWFEVITVEYAVLVSSEWTMLSILLPLTLNGTTLPVAFYTPIRVGV